MVKFRKGQPASADRSSESLRGEYMLSWHACLPSWHPQALLILCSSSLLTLENETFFLVWLFSVFRYIWQSLTNDCIDYAPPPHTLWNYKFTFYKQLI